MRYIYFEGTRVVAFVKELREVCARHKLGMVATCNTEGIFGELVVFDLVQPDVSTNWSGVTEEMNKQFDGMLEPEK